MPVISYFFGIYVRMYHDDHNPPHFHAEYQGHEAFVEIATGQSCSPVGSGLVFCQSLESVIAFSPCRDPYESNLSVRCIT